MAAAEAAPQHLPHAQLRVHTDGGAFPAPSPVRLWWTLELVSVPKGRGIENIMGIDYLTCTACGDAFPDCSGYVTCNEDFGGCGSRFCRQECAQYQKGPAEEDGDYQAFSRMTAKKQEREKSSCTDCRGENATDTNLLNFLLELTDMSRGEAEKQYLFEKHKSRMRKK